MPKVNKKISYLKCRRCRYDRQKCVPREREWPGQRCDRCEKYNYRCSENCAASREPENNQQPVGREADTAMTNSGYEQGPAHTIETTPGIPANPNAQFEKAVSVLTASQCVEELTYLRWLWDSLGPAAQLLEDLRHVTDRANWGAWMRESPRLPSVDKFIRTFKSVYQDVIHVATSLAVDSQGELLVLSQASLGQQILSYHKAFQPTNHTDTSLLSKMVNFCEGKGDLPAAQQYQEQLLATLTTNTNNGQTSDEMATAVQRLVELYKKSRDRLRVVASRLGLEIDMCLGVLPMLHQAVSRNSDLLASTIVSKLSELDGNYANLGNKDILGRTICHCAVGRHGTEILRILIEGERYLDDRDFLGRTALQVTAGRGDLEVAELLLSRSADVNATPARYNGRTALQAAAGGGYLGIVELLLSQSAHVNGDPAPHNGRTALQAAAEGGHLEIVELLISESADVNADLVPDNGRTALQAAAEGGHLRIVKLLLSKSAYVNAGPAYLNGRTTLQAAARGGHLRIVELLLSKSAHVNAGLALFGGRTALQAAAQGGHLRIVELLLSKSAYVNADPAFDNGRTALQAAAEGGHLRVVELLLSQSAHVNADPAEFFGKTALQAAAKGGHLEIVKLLLRHLPEFDINSFKGQQVFNAASGYPEIRGLLRTTSQVG